MTSFANDARPRTRPGIAERIVDGEALLVNPAGGEILVLNETGALIWQLLDGSHDVAALVARVVAEYDIAPEPAHADVLAFLEALHARGALAV